MKKNLPQLIRQFLVHSFLYYQLDESLISDSAYDQLVMELQQAFSDSAEPLQSLDFYDLALSAAGKEGSGFSIKNYPETVVNLALKLLYQQKYKSWMPFEEFLQRFGYRVRRPQETPVG